MTESLSLRDIYLFAHLSDQLLAEIGAALRPRELQSGEVLFNVGDPGDELYVVESGQIAIYSPDAAAAGQEKPIRVFERAAVLGEMTLIDRKPRSVSARALCPTRLLALGADDFRRFVGRSPELALAVMAGLSDRIRYTTDFLNEVRGWITRLKDGQYDRAAAAAGGVPHGDETLTTLAAEFAEMALQVQQREAALRREISELKIEIDNVRRAGEVQRITQSENFKALKEKARRLRAERDD